MLQKNAGNWIVYELFGTQEVAWSARATHLRRNVTKSTIWVYLGCARACLFWVGHTLTRKQLHLIQPDTLLQRLHVLPGPTAKVPVHPLTKLLVSHHRRGPTIKPLLLPRSPKYVILRLIRLRCYDERLCVRSVQPFLKGPPNWPSTVARLASPAISCWMAGSWGWIRWIHAGQLESAFCSAFENSSERASCCHWRRRHLGIIIQGHRVKNHILWDSCPNHPRCQAIYSNSVHFTCWSLRFRAEVPIAACRAALQLQLNEPVLSAKRKRGNQHFCREPPKRLGLLLLNCFFCCKKRRTKHFFCLRQRYGTATSIASLSKCSFWTTNECLLTSLCIMNMRWRLWHCWM